VFFVARQAYRENEKSRDINEGLDRMAKDPGLREYAQTPAWGLFDRLAAMLCKIIPTVAAFGEEFSVGILVVVISSATHKWPIK
jgi:hypothetical protein